MSVRGPMYFTLVLLLFAGQTVIFLLRLVAADRRTRRTPLDPNAKKTVGQMEDDVATAPESVSDAKSQDKDESQEGTD